MSMLLGKAPVNIESYNKLMIQSSDNVRRGRQGFHIKTQLSNAVQ